MTPLLTALVEGRLGAVDERSLLGAHHHHFQRRVSALDRAFFPGEEKTPDSTRSLGNGAYASFQSEPLHEGRPAFHHTIARALPPEPFLYYWRSSATIDFLRREGPDLLRARLRILRNVQIHLRQGFDRLGTRLGADLWGLRSWAESPPIREQGSRIDPAELASKIGSKRGKAAVIAVLEAAGAPLTKSEIAAAFVEAEGFARTVDGVKHEPPEPDAPAPEATVLAREVSVRARAFFLGLGDDEKKLLALRGFAAGASERRSLREVAALLGRRGEETYRLLEQGIFARLRETFDDPEEHSVAAHVLSECLAEHVTKDAALSAEVGG